MPISKAKIKYVKSLAMKKYRDEEGIFVAEGPKIIKDLSESFELVELFEGEDVGKLSLLDTPNTQLALFRKKKDVPLSPDYCKHNLVLALDDIQNPGNLGTIIRMADWFGVTEIICSNHCADIYNPKTIQATMGSLARTNVHYCELSQYITQIESDISIYGTFLDGENIYEANLSDSGLIIMGNEGHGISPAIAEIVNQKLLIPNFPPSRHTGDSLNVAIATAITLSEFRRRLQ